MRAWYARPGEMRKLHPDTITRYREFPNHQQAIAIR
jgi:hypothetical protein